MALRLYVVRHGQTDWNAQRRLQGTTDTVLNDFGRTQAAGLARLFGSLDLSSIYSSQLIRSRDTAAALAGLAPIKSLALLDEQALGVFEGRYLDGREPAVVESYFNRLARLDDNLDGGESVNQHLVRVAAAIDFIRSAHSRGRQEVLVVGHGATNAAILRHLFGLGYLEARALRPRNGELFIIDFGIAGQPRGWERASAPR